MRGRAPGRIFALRAVAYLTLQASFLASTPVSASENRAEIERHIQRIQAALLPAVIVKDEPPDAPTLAARMQAVHVPGVGVAVIKDGAIEWARGFGDGITPNTLFQAASISKPVSAVAAMHLVESGKLQLDADINGSLKSWQVPQNEFTKQSPVTLRGLLTHSAGVNVHGFGGYEFGTPVPTLVQLLKGEPPANNPPIQVDKVPGKSWRYSGGGYEIAQLAMQDATGMPYPKLMQELVLGPFGMKHSSYGGRPDLAKVATPYRADGTPVKGGPHLYPEHAAAALWTTPSDLARFALGVHRALEGKEKRVLSAENARAMLVPAFNQQSIGFVVGGHTERKWFNHGGANEGYRCLMWAYQDGRDGAVIMTNSDNGGPLQDQLIRTIAHEYGWPDLAPVERVLDKAVAPQTFDRFVGAYRFANGRVFTFWREGSQVRSRIVGQGAVDLFPSSAQEYFAKLVDARLTFDQDSATLFQNDIAQKVTRVDDRSELDWSIATEKRVKAQTPAATSEALLRRMVVEIGNGNPPYEILVPALAQVVRDALPGLRAMMNGVGELQSLTYKRTEPNGLDVYDVKGSKGTQEMGVLIQADGKVFAAR